MLCLCCPQAERLVRGSVWRKHHRRLWGLHGRCVRDVRAAQRPPKPAQDYQQSPGQGLSAGLLHRCKHGNAAKKAIKAASLRNSIQSKINKALLFNLVPHDSSFCVYFITDYKCLWHGGCYFQEASERPRLLSHRFEGGLSAFWPHLLTYQQRTLMVLVCLWLCVT